MVINSRPFCSVYSQIMHVFRILLLFVDVSFAEVIAGLHAAGGIGVRGTDGERKIGEGI